MTADGHPNTEMEQAAAARRYSTRAWCTMAQAWGSIAPATSELASTMGVRGARKRHSKGERQRYACAVRYTLHDVVLTRGRRASGEEVRSYEARVLSEMIRHLDHSESADCHGLSSCSAGDGKIQRDGSRQPEDSPSRSQPHTGRRCSACGRLPGRGTTTAAVARDTEHMCVA